MNSINLSELNSLIYKNNLQPGSLTTQTQSTICWLKNKIYYNSFHNGYLLINGKDYNTIECHNENIIHVIVENSRLEYSKIIQQHFSNLGLVLCDDTNTHITREDLYIGNNVYIGKDVKIGLNTKIHNNVVIHNNTTIGNNCIIKENVTIGSEGLGFEWDGDDLIKFPQIGGVTIGDNVEINTYTDIKRGTLDDTIIGNHCKVGSYINIGHNVQLGEKCILTSQCILAGSSKIGDMFFMGINSSVKNGVVVGNNVMLGAHSYINTNVPDNQQIIGVSSKNKFVK